MKQHKTIFTVATMLLMAGGMFTACTNDDLSSVPVPEGNSESKVYTLCIEAQKGGGASQRALAEDGDVIRSTWATTDKVYVKKGDSWFTGELQPQSNGSKSTTLSGKLKDLGIAAGDVLTLQYFKKGDMNYDGQVGTLADISENFNYATAEVTVSSVDAKGNVYVTGSANFKYQQAIVKLTLLDTDGNNLNATKLTVISGDKTFTVTPASATNVVYVAIPGSIKANIDGFDGSYLYVKSLGPISNGSFKSFTTTMNKIIENDTGFIKVYTTYNGGYKIPKSDTINFMDVWNEDPYNFEVVPDASWGTSNDWDDIIEACGGIAHEPGLGGYRFINAAVSTAGISDWTPMSGSYFTCSRVSEYLWSVINDRITNLRPDDIFINESKVRTLTPFTD